ncbi:tumor p63-regulated protein 1 [Brachionus plicatilis]|uniref:Tumor p63-regulated protein 1 n=1 Tax=Brachionus plicatilis TaxID=10195 RepID=A0A3M7RTZ9_BRAPC|nr:tumor p63-regulated protein 1 [Brachionus plicatilis]
MEPNVHFNSNSSETKIQMEPKTFENKAFEHEDESLDKTNPFRREDRPGSMYSVRTNASTTSRSSVNCTSGAIRCPNMRLKQFFSYSSETGFQKAELEIKKLILLEKDGQFIGNWLLIEISNWDFHREKIVMLVEKAIYVISFDFIKSKLTGYKRIAIGDLKKIKFGLLKYPKSSFMGEYKYGAIKLSWDNEENLSFFQKWNPLSDIPFTIFTSHHILYNEKEQETSIYNCDEFIASLEFVLSKIPEGSNIEFKEEPVEIESYASLTSVLYNQNWLGFQLDRNGINF